MVWPKRSRNCSSTAAGAAPSPTRTTASGPDRARLVGRQLQQADVDRRHAEEERRLEVLEPVERLGRLEPLGEAHQAAGGEPRADAVAEAVDVESGSTAR